MALLFNAKDKGTLVTTEGEKVEIKINNDLEIYNKYGLDIRPKMKISAFHKNTGAFISYSHGLSNYAPKMEYSDFQAYFRLIRFGMNYRFSKL